LIAFPPRVRVSFPEALTDADSVPIVLGLVDEADGFEPPLDVEDEVEDPVEDTDPPEDEELPAEEAVAVAVVLKVTSVEPPALVSSMV